MHEAEATYAIVFTDLVESTRMAATVGDAAMAALWAAHDDGARRSIRRWRGREVGRSDGFLVLFDSGPQAVGFAMDYHHGLGVVHPLLKARVGIHVGRLTLRRNRPEETLQGATPFEADGIALPVAARVMAAARGGQTLITAAARATLDPAAGTRVQSHGYWRLKGLAEPLELFEIGPDAMAFVPPPHGEKAYRVVRKGDGWHSVEALPHSLPVERDAFIGRAEALGTLACAFDGGTRLVTLLGMGGIGKTRLALSHARGWLGDYAGGAWFCDLSSARGLEGICHAVAQGLGLRLDGDQPVAQIADAIANRGRCLVIVDNFEQVARFAEQTLGRWLDRAPQARFIATSREVLGIAGESVLALPPLTVPEAVELFLLRARSAQMGFDPVDADRDAVDRLARTLDGLPLAIELAAARVRTVSPQQLLQRMHHRFDLLHSRGGRPDRQATLRATLDWSWELLNAAERAMLSQLAVFEGGFDLQAAEAVVEVPDGTTGIDLLGSLVDKSLVRQLDGGRFGLLESVRDYARLQLQAWRAAQPDAPAVVGLRSRHGRHYASLSEQAAVAQHCADLDNLLAACRVACEAGDSAIASRCLVNAWAALRLTGPYGTAVECASRVAAIGGSADERGLAHWVWGSALDMQGQVEAARARFRQGLAHTAAAAPGEAHARLLLALGSQLTLEGDTADAQAHLEQALRHAAELRLDALQAVALNALGRLMDHQSRVAEAQQLYERALALARAMGDRLMEGGLLGNLGGLHLDLGELDTAREHYEQALAVAEQTGDRRWQGNACSNLGLVLLQQGRHDEARARLGQARELARGTGSFRLEYTVACNLGILLARQGQLAEAERHLRDAVAAASGSADRRSEAQFRGYLALALARQGRLDEARAEVGSGEQGLRALSDRLSLALLICDRAELEWLTGAAEAAQHAWDEAAAIADALGCGAQSELRRRMQEVAALMLGGAPAPPADEALRR